MNSIRNLWPAALAAVTLATASATVEAGSGHRYHSSSRVQFGITLGAPLWYADPWYYRPYYPAYPPYPVYTYPAPVIVQAPPRVYVERDPAAAVPDLGASSPYWYFCRDSNTYYPYVRECAGDWERVPARPASVR